MHIKSRSLTLYRTKFQPAFALRYSLRNLEFRDGILNIPLYMADYTKELIEII